MGVPSIWDLVKPAFHRRVPFPVFASEFYRDFRRPIRISIDAYQWIFECRGGYSAVPSPMNKEQIAKFIQNFIGRIRYLIQFNISFVLVFDGRLKPSFKRNKVAQKQHSIIADQLDFDVDYSHWLELIKNGDFKENDSPDVSLLKKILGLWGITFVEAPADGEAEAARLQKAGVVDYVLSNDSDVLIYGGTRVLRNFSKFNEDKPAGAILSSTNKQTQEYWCTPVVLVDIESKTGYDQNRLRLFSILLGGDYNPGVTSLGALRAGQLALIGTNFIIRHSATFDYGDLPDFSKELNDIYTSGMWNTDGRKAMLEDFKVDLLESIQENTAVLFRRRGSFNLDGFPPDYVIALYHKPLLLNEMFAFNINDTNFAEFHDDQDFVKGVNLERLCSELNKCMIPVKDVGQWFTMKFTEAYLLRSIIKDSPEFEPTLEKISERTIGDGSACNTSKYYSTRYQITWAFETPSRSVWNDEDPQLSPRKKNGELSWIPKELVAENRLAYRSYLERIITKADVRKPKMAKKQQINDLSKFLKPKLQDNALGEMSNIPKLTPTSSYVILKPSSVTKPTLSPRRSKLNIKGCITVKYTPSRVPQTMDILTQLKNSPRKVTHPVFAGNTPETSPVKCPKRRDDDHEDDSFGELHLIDTSMNSPKSRDVSIITLDSQSELESVNGDDMMDISKSSRKLDFAHLVDTNDDDDSSLQILEAQNKQIASFSEVNILDEIDFSDDTETATDLNEERISQPQDTLLGTEKPRDNLIGLTKDPEKTSILTINGVGNVDAIENSNTSPFKNIEARQRTVNRSPFKKRGFSLKADTMKIAISQPIFTSPPKPKIASSINKEFLKSALSSEEQFGDENGKFTSAYHQTSINKVTHHYTNPKEMPTTKKPGFFKPIFNPATSPMYGSSLLLTKTSVEKLKLSTLRDSPSRPRSHLLEEYSSKLETFQALSDTLKQPTGNKKTPRTTATMTKQVVSLDSSDSENEETR